MEICIFMLIETTSTQPTISPWWTILSSIGSMAAAAGACYAAFQARATVGEMKNERLERRRLEAPELSIDGVSISTPDIVDIDFPVFDYCININNVKESKILDIKYVIALFYRSFEDNNIIDVPMVKCKRYYGEYPRKLSAEITIFNTDFSEGVISMSVGFFVVNDVYLNEKKIMGQLNHMGEWDDVFESRFAHSKPVEVVTMSDFGRKEITAGITVLEEDVKEKVLNSIVNVISDRDEETLAFVNSFRKNKRSFPWYIKIFQ